MKEGRILLLIACVVGGGACFWAFKHGPIALPTQQQKTFEAPPGWMPPVAPKMNVPVTPALSQR